MFKQRCFRLLLLASAIATSLSAAAYSFESAGIYYNITGNNTVEVTYSDRDNNTYSGSISVPETVTNNGTEYSVTKIGEYAFQNSAVTSVSMPECITSIGQYACNECGSLETVVLPTNLDDFSGWCIFRNCRNLKNIAIPENVTEIPNGTFSGCKNLESVTLPESLKTFGYNAFRSCKSLKTVKIPSGVTAIPSSCFRECSSLESVTIPEGVMTIEDGAFQSCNLNALALPESLEAIGSSAFNGNQSLKSVNIPAKVKTIEESAFYNCGLTDLVIQEGVQTIDNYAFNSNSLQNLTLPSTITSIGNNAFLYNSNLQSITCNAATPPTLGDNAFSSGIMSDVKVPLASIAAYRKAYGWKDFSNYYGGEEIIDGVAYRIDDKGAYVQAAIMTESEICLAENVAFEGAQYPLYKIADNAFAGNGSITLVTVPATVETIGSNAFDGVTYPIIKIKATTPPVLASKLPMLSAIVPPASVKAYKAANYWKDMTIIGEGKNDIEVTTSATVDLTEAIMTQAKITPASVTSIKVHGPLTNDDIINALNTNMRSCYAIARRSVQRQNRSARNHASCRLESHRQQCVQGMLCPAQ